VLALVVIVDENPAGTISGWHLVVLADLLVGVGDDFRFFSFGPSTGALEFVGKDGSSDAVVVKSAFSLFGTGD
jgi:hypothetical protein